MSVPFSDDPDLPAGRPVPTRHHEAAYAQRMNKVLDHIDAHLDRDLGLPTLAQMAHFSPFHFHRLFAAWMGETLGDYLRRRRLERAALKLSATSTASVLDVAMSVGFGSGEAFARAFKLRFGETPTAWRAGTSRRWQAQLEATRDRRVSRNPDQARDPGLANHGDSFPTESFMDVTLHTLAPARVAYLRHIGPYGPPIARFWRETAMPWLAAHGLDQAPRYGIGRDDPCITAPEQCRYDACVDVPPDFVARSPAGIERLPGGRYAVARFEGHVDDLAATYTELLRDCLPASGLQADDRPFYEYYPPGARYDREKGTFECRICLAVRAA